MEPSTMRSLRFLPFVVVLGVCSAAQAQSPKYGLGRAPTPEEIRAWDISISPTGKELPPGSGTAKQGADIFAEKCAVCHGAEGSGGLAPILIRRKEPPPNANKEPCVSPCIRDATVMSLHSPYATTIWDFINRGMPFSKEGSLKPNEVYALTAFLLYKNDVIAEDFVVDAQSLPQIKMPNHDHFVVPQEDWKHGAPRAFANPANAPNASK